MLFRKVLALLFLTFPAFLFAQESGKSIDQRIEEGFKPISDFIYWLVFYPISFGGYEMPFVVLILILGGIFFSIYFKFANIRLAKVAVNATRGKYDEIDLYGVYEAEGDSTPGGDIIETVRKEEVHGEVTHFQALTAALSATVGLGNIAGVSIAIALGGPGATIWMILVGLLGMSTKIGEATLGVKYREIDEEGKTYGGPMYYLRKGLANKNMPILGKILAAMFAICVIGGSLGSGNMFQSNQAASQFQLLFDLESGFWFGIVIAILVGLVIIGGIKRIGMVTERVVPFMAIMFVGSALLILAINYDLIPTAFGLIWDGAFNARSAMGGFIGVMIVGFQRGAFSNEAGVGSSAIAHSAVRTRYPASEGLVASIGPFVDTVVICTMTALVIVITNLKNNLFDYANLDESGNVILNATGESLGGVDLTSIAFESTIPHFSIVLTIAVILFAFSTMLSWSYYGIQGWKYLFGKGRVADLTYKALFLFFIIIGASSSMESVVFFADAMLFAMVFPNMIGLVILAPQVKTEIARYLRAIRIIVIEEQVPEEGEEKKVIDDG
ncbi:alanine:cation symporter family protein [Membranicola marinus]|uniref:Alanine:cation symporter family protein n=1 Tax=Membranihabitans marinus TaxID=1227546 RepID=A0A953HU50_9BACT|nr:alanine/glycine:cation symporter family protein [Membranihabitans marinus]MBY5958360.1 alanine:cation symporter family protein [Membranihabitans marinus]